jgi:hypothetical protein
MWVPPTDRAPPRLTARRSNTATVGRCGHPIGAGDPYVQVENLPDAVVELYEGQSYCSARCVRADLLEALNILDPLDTLTAGELVSDLRVACVDLAAAFASILDATGEPDAAAP